MTTYEIIEPELVGESQNLFVLGKHSDVTLTEKMKELGYEFTTEERDAVFEAFKN